MDEYDVTHSFTPVLFVRLDYFLSHSTSMPRSEARRAIQAGRVSVNGDVLKKASAKVSDMDSIALDGNPLTIKGPVYLMMHKPLGVVCSTEDAEHRTVIDLIEPSLRKDLHPAGRLDLDTSGLVLLTNDGQWSHRITSPVSKQGKVYRVTLADAVRDDAIKQLENGILLRNESKPTMPALAEQLAENQIRLTIFEGRYHQVKRMFAALGNRVIALHREAIGGIGLDSNLEPGCYRPLDDDEIEGVFEPVVQRQ